jgi:hypothetical protein
MRDGDGVICVPEARPEACVVWEVGTGARQGAVARRAPARAEGMAWHGISTEDGSPAAAIRRGYRRACGCFCSMFGRRRPITVQTARSAPAPLARPSSLTRNIL